MIAKWIHYVAVFVIGMFLVLTAQAQTAPAPAATNVQVLSGLSPDQLVWAMGFISQSLGVTCDYCHVRADRSMRWDLDDKKEKQTARSMLSMTKAINDQHFGGQERITCASCHNGHPQPQTSNPVVDLDALRTRSFLQRQPTNYPPASNLLARYEQVIGGSAALARLKTRIDEYVVDEPAGIASARTLRKSPNKWLEATTRGQSSVTSWIFDGNAAQIVSQAGSRSVTGLDLNDITFTADFWRELKLADRYSKAETIGRDKLDGHDVFIVRGRVKGSAIEERLFLDADSGLLLRRMTFKPTALGTLADRTDFEDYRVADGIKVPFVVRAATGAFATIRHYSRVQFDVPVDDATFAVSGVSQKRPGQQ